MRRVEKLKTRVEYKTWQFFYRKTCLQLKEIQGKFGFFLIVAPRLLLGSKEYVSKQSTVVHDFNGHEVNGKHGFNGKKCYDGGFYVVNNGKIDV